jgi:hypothetical protein
MTTWGVQLNTLEQRATEHDQFAAALVSQLADPLKTLATRTEELRKLHGEYAAKLEKERDGQYAELRKTKGKYDSVCQEVESRRKKVDGAFDHGKNKARNAFEQQQVEMRNVKNTYLITINVTNKQKEMYYHEYVPELLDVGISCSHSRSVTNSGAEYARPVRNPCQQAERNLVVSRLDRDPNAYTQYRVPAASFRRDPSQQPSTRLDDVRPT